MKNNNQTNKIIIIVLVILVGVGAYFAYINKVKNNLGNVNTTTKDIYDKSIVYANTEYGFVLTIPNTWKGYSVINGTVEFGKSVTIRHPDWTGSQSHMDIPILIYPIEQWKKWEATNFEGYPTAAPIGPTERGRNAKYVFATAPRYNYSFAPGYEEVEEIIKGLKTF